MNILPKKSWHVRNKDNIERVRRDEENARKAEKERERRAGLAEQEARTALLRDRASMRQVEDAKSHEMSLVLVSDKPQHLNLFADIAQPLQHGSNPEYEAEKKAEQEKREKAIGLLTYLGQSATEEESAKLWYVKSHKDRTDLNDASQSSKDSNRKTLMDPLTKMKKFLEVTKECRDKKQMKEKRGKYLKYNDTRCTERDSRRREKKSLNELRTERLQREKEEHAREQRLLASVRGDKSREGTESSAENAPHRYNSQYNPEFVRRPRNDSRYQPY